METDRRIIVGLFVAVCRVALPMTSFLQAQHIFIVFFSRILSNPGVFNVHINDIVCKPMYVIHACLSCCVSCKMVEICTCMSM